MSWERIRRRATTTAAVVTVPVVVAVLALMNPGYPLARVELNDGAVWLTATSQLKLGRYNVQVDELNAGLVTESGTFDVLQDEGDVLLVEAGSVAVVDPATVALTTQVTASGIQPSAVPGGAVSMAAGVVSVVDDEGDAFVRRLSDLNGLQPADDEPDVALGEGGRAVVSRGGLALAVDATGAVTRVDVRTGTAKVSAGEPFEAGALDQLTAVGDVPVGLRDSMVVLPGRTVELQGTDLTLQQPGPESSRVLVASSDALIEVPLDGGDPVTHRTSGQGKPAAPVQVDGCAHAAWASAAGSYLRLCEDEDVVELALEDMSAQDQLTFRVNRSVVVLNDTLRGRVWEPQEDTDLRVPNWQDIEQQEDPEKNEDSDDSPETTQELVEKCSAESSSPQAADDEFGVRAGRTTILPVISNDSSSDCGILVVSTFDPIPEDFGTVEAIYGGRALQVRIKDGASGSESFTYQIQDGRIAAPSTATVTLTVHGDDENEPPVQDRTGAMEVEQGGQARYDVLANFHDPDGDDMLVVGATADAAIGSVRFRQDGTITFRADGGQLGRTTMTVLVSDGSQDEPTEGEVVVDVRPTDAVPPQVDPVHAETYVGQAVTLAPLDAVRTSGSDPAQLVSVEDVAGATVTSDLQAGTFTFSAPRIESYYVSFVVVSGSQQATGLARIDVKAFPESPEPPIAVRDRAFLPAGGQTTIDPLANDTDPAGALLVLQSVGTDDAGPLNVAVLDHHLVQISSDQTLDHVVVLPYVVSNGVKKARGEIVVQPIPPSASTQPPVVENVEATVRTGGVVTIPVLDSAYDPDGDALTLVRDLAEDVGDGEGLLFVSGDVLRYQAPSDPMTVHATFVVEDATGNRTAGSLTVRVHESDPETKAPPTPRDLDARVFAGETVRIDVPLVGIDPDGDGVALLGLASGPLKGRIVGQGPDWLEYEAFATRSGTDVFTYAVEDWVGQRAVATIRVGISPRPSDAASVVARDDAVTIRPGERIEVRVLANDIDSSGDELTLSPVLEVPEGIDATVADRRVVVTAPRKEQVAKIVYTATNSRGGRDSAVLTVTVDEDAPVLPPIARDVVVPATETFGLTEVVVDVLATSQNPSGPPSDLEVSVPSSVAATATVRPDKKILVTLTDQTQTLPFLLTNVRDPEHATAYAFITVPPLGFIRPTLRPGAPELRVAQGDTLTLSLGEQVKVAQGREPSVADALAVSATNGTATSSKDGGSLLFTPNEDYIGPASVTLPVTDATGPGDTGARTAYLSFSIEVYAIDDHPPTFSASEQRVAPNEAPATVDLRDFTTTPEGQTPEDDRYSYQLTAAVPAGFRATLEGSTLSLSADADTPRGASGVLQLRIGYGRAGSLDAQVPIKATASQRPKASVVDRRIDDASEGEPVTVNVLEGAFNPFPETPLRVLGATVETPGAGAATATASTVTVTPREGFIGQMVVRYRVRDAVPDPEREVEGRITLTVRGAPATPTRPRVEAIRSRTVVLSWAAPDNRGAQILDYALTAHGDDGSAPTTTCASTTCTFDGLTNDVEYTFTVAARNDVGTSEDSPASGPARPDSVPEAPASVTGEGYGNGELSWSWADSVTDGSAIESYEVQIRPDPPSGGDVRSRPGTALTWSGLANGTRYQIRVRAHSKADDPSGWTPWSAEQSPAGPAGAPTDVSAQRDASADFGKLIDVSWSTPSVKNAEQLTGYRVTVTSAQGFRLATDLPLQNRWTFDQAENGVDYTFVVQARNKYSDDGKGEGEKSSPATARAFGQPTTPQLTDVAAPAGTGEITVQWAAVDDRGAAVTYHVYEDGKEVDTTKSLSTRLTGRVGGTTYTYKVMAENEAGKSGFSAEKKVMATTAPGRPTGLGIAKTAPAGVGKPETIHVTWDAVDSGGGNNLRYDYELRMGGRSSGTKTTSSTGADVDVSSWDVSLWGSEFTLVVTARTDIKSGESASASTTISWGEVPSTPTNLQVALDSATAPTSVTATWGAPVNGGGAGDVRYEYCWYPERTGRTCGSTAEAGPLTVTLAELGAEQSWRDRQITFQIRAINDKGGSDWIQEWVTVPAQQPDPEPTPDPTPAPTDGTSG
ncbi:fibronectin type III domain-containing protein [Cellulomonas sp. DKR-3]|uniref:Fibronectin type III domain-containing protein n=1 Tax=Cellulomonas fulva TaxID=2835530 RepID=A0ABS5U017_9CELL|nr:Ig-like domain-containing protein [Cellulomonas fulva]MBT0994753.1 fibronectin type III domain-containing protein [Cellulomonas fulva]